MLTLPRFFAFTMALLAALAGVVLLLAVRTAGQAIVAVGETSRNQTATRIAAALEADVSAAERAITDFEQALALGIVTTGDNAALHRYLSAEIIALPNLTDLTFTGGVFQRYDDEGAMVLTAAGRHQVAVTRDRSGTIATSATDRVLADSDADPTTHLTFRTPAHRDWRGRSLWSDLAYSQLDQALPPERQRMTMSVQKAIFDAEGRFVGVLRAGIVSDTLDRFASQRTSGDPHRLFICDTDGRLITRLSPSDRYDVVDQQGKPDPDGDLRVVPQAMPPAMAAALQMAQTGTRGGARLSVNGRLHFMTIVPVAQGRTQDWLVGVVVPESYYVGTLLEARDRLLILLAVVVLVIAAVGLGGARAVGTGIQALVNTTEQMRHFSFQASPASSHFREIRAALAGVERAKTALRAMVKYVPVGLVRRLYESGRDPVLGAELTEVSLMFTDIADFTTHAESLRPDVLAAALGRYLETATAAVEATGGTVDKYIGDALMVLWNAPDAVENHPVAACRAAIACAAATEELCQSRWWQDAGLPPWRTRFGLHVDRVLVGHFGAPERLSYTAMGDGVNLAARLEGLNKTYGTTILVSDDLRQRAGDGFAFRLIDQVAVKGRSRGVAVYELLGPADDPKVIAQKPRTGQYETAWRAAQNRDFAAALDLLVGMTDGPSTVLAKRCEGWRQNPPPPDWDGTFIATSK